MNLFHGFRISNALDTKEPLSPALRGNIANSDELKVFSRWAAEVDQSLRNEVPQSDSPTWLHGSVMNAIRAEERAVERKDYFPALRQFALGACVVAIGFGIWGSLNRPAPTQPASIAGVVDALDFRNEINETIPKVQVSLSDELERLNHDLDNATQTLIATLP